MPPMAARRWSGQHAKRMVALTLDTKGRTCHLCGLDGADSADHDPPRTQLVLDGVADPDALEYLWPAHKRPCNFMRGTLPITDELRAALRVRRLAHVAGQYVAPLSEHQASTQPPPRLAVAVDDLSHMSPRFRERFREVRAHQAARRNGASG